MALLPVASRPWRTIFRVGAPRIYDIQLEILLGILQLAVIGSLVDRSLSMKPIAWNPSPGKNVPREV
jgi:hypothetical protein